MIFDYPTVEGAATIDATTIGRLVPGVMPHHPTKWSEHVVPPHLNVRGLKLGIASTKQDLFTSALDVIVDYLMGTVGPELSALTLLASASVIALRFATNAGFTV
jgi:hypothetical protein